MGITTGGGVAFDEGASVRSAGQAFEQTAGRMQQESQYKRTQALLAADQSFGQLIKLGVASGNLEKFIAEHPQQFASVEQLMSAAAGRKISLAEGLQQGLGAVSGGFAENPSLQRMTYEYLQRLPKGDGGGGGEGTTPAPGPGPAPAPSPPGTVNNVPRTNKANFGPGMGVQEGDITLQAEQPQFAFQRSGTTPDGTVVRALSNGPLMNDVDARLYNGDDGYSAWLEESKKMGLMPEVPASTAESATVKAESVAAQRAKSPLGMDLSDGEVFATKGVKSAHELGRMALSEFDLGSVNDTQAWVEEFMKLNPGVDINNIPPSVVLPKIEAQTQALTNTDARAGTGARRVLRIIPRGGDRLQKEAERPAAKGQQQSMNNEVGPSLGEYAQGNWATDARNQQAAEIASIRDFQQNYTVPTAYTDQMSPGVGREPRFESRSMESMLPIADRGVKGPQQPVADLTSDATLTSGVKPQKTPQRDPRWGSGPFSVEEYLTAHPETQKFDAIRASIASELPGIKAETAAKLATIAVTPRGISLSATPKTAMREWTKTLDKTSTALDTAAAVTEKTLSSLENRTAEEIGAPVGSAGMDWDKVGSDAKAFLGKGEALKQRDKMTLAEAQTRAMKISDEVKNMDEETFQKVRKEHLDWINSASPMELEAAGMPEVASRAEAMQIADIQAYSSYANAMARAGSEQAKASVELSSKAAEQIDKVWARAQKMADGLKNKDGATVSVPDVIANNPALADEITYWSRIAYNAPKLNVDFALKANEWPEWAQRITHWGKTVAPVTTGVRYSNGSTPAPRTETKNSLVGKYSSSAKP